MSAAEAQLAHWLPDRSLPLIQGSTGEILRRHAAVRGHRTALIWPDGDDLCRMSYQELLERAVLCAGWLMDIAQLGDRIAIWSRNALEAVILQHASGLAGTILVHFNPAWKDAEVEHALRLTRPAILIAGVDGREQELIGRAKHLAHCPVIDIRTVLERRSEQRDRDLPEVRQTDPYLIQFTSGTTGQAKGALLSHRAALMGGWLRPAIEGADENDVWLNAVPYSHVAGTCAIILGALSIGAAFVVLERFDAGQVASLIEPSGATRMGGVPTMWHDILSHESLPADARVEQVTLGGASVAPDLVRHVKERLGAHCAIGYGQSECTIVTATMTGDSLDILTESVGRPLPHVELKIVDPETGQTVRAGDVGEICVRAPSAMDGYWEDPSATAEAIDKDGFLHTGDLGSMTELGVCKIHGRKRDVIIRGGENIYPAEIEGVLLSHPDVANVAVIGGEHPRLGQEAVAVVKLVDGARAGQTALKSFVSDHLAHFKVPSLWHFVDELPMTASGKVRKVDLEAMFCRT